MFSRAVKLHSYNNLLSSVHTITVKGRWPDCNRLSNMTEHLFYFICFESEACVRPPFHMQPPSESALSGWEVEKEPQRKRFYRRLV